MVRLAGVVTAIRSSHELEHELRDSTHSWLGEQERNELERFRHFQRRRAWLDARWLAKVLLCEEAAMSLRPEAMSRWQVLSAPQAGRGRRPAVLFEDHPQALSLSISHASNVVFVAFTSQPNAVVGVDLVVNERLGKSFQHTWFSARERQAAAGSNLRAAKIWASKEAVYKACNQGEGFAPHAVEIFTDGGEPISASYRSQPLGDACQLRCWDTTDRCCALAVRREEGGSVDAR